MTMPLNARIKAKLTCPTGKAGPVALAIVAGLLALSALHCGTVNNVSDCEKRTRQVPCSSRTMLEDAVLALDQGDFTKAILLLTDVISREPGVYTHVPLLAASYAARSGLDILNITKVQFGGGGGSFLTALTSFLPTPAQRGAAYPQSVADMKMAVTVLTQIPPELLANVTGDKYAASAVLQLSLYHASYAAMLLNEFVLSAASGQIDIAQLGTMTEAQAIDIVQNLAAAGQIPQLAGNPGLTAQVTKDLAQIQSQSGATTKAKLAAFVAAQGAAGTGTLTGTGTGTGS